LYLSTCLHSRTQTSRGKKGTNRIIFTERSPGFRWKRIGVAQGLKGPEKSSCKSVKSAHRLPRGASSKARQSRAARHQKRFPFGNRLILSNNSFHKSKSLQFFCRLRVSLKIEILQRLHEIFHVLPILEDEDGLHHFFGLLPPQDRDA
jgi:hypothetical protein